MMSILDSKRLLKRHESLVSILSVSYNTKEYAILFDAYKLYIFYKKRINEDSSLKTIDDLDMSLLRGFFSEFLLAYDKQYSVEQSEHVRLFSSLNKFFNDDASNDFKELARYFDFSSDDNFIGRFRYYFHDYVNIIEKEEELKIFNDRFALITNRLLGFFREICDGNEKIIFSYLNYFFHFIKIAGVTQDDLELAKELSRDAGFSINDIKEYFIENDINEVVNLYKKVKYIKGGENYAHIYFAIFHELGNIKEDEYAGFIEVQYSELEIVLKILGEEVPDKKDQYVIISRIIKNQSYEFFKFLLNDKFTILNGDVDKTKKKLINDFNILPSKEDRLSRFTNTKLFKELIENIDISLAKSREELMGMCLSQFSNFLDERHLSNVPSQVNLLSKSEFSNTELFKQLRKNIDPKMTKSKEKLIGMCFLQFSKFFDEERQLPQSNVQNVSAGSVKGACELYHDGLL